MLTHGARRWQVVVVEGESDFNLLSDFLQKDDLELVVGYGKASLLEASVPALHALPEVTFLVDADFDRLTNEASAFPENVIATDYYDLYMDAHFSDENALRRVARRFLKKSAVQEVRAIEMSMRAAGVIGALRFLSQSESYFLNLEAFPMHIVMPTDIDEAINIRDVVKLAVGRTRRDDLECDEIVRRLPEVTQSLFLINSHDLLSALRVVCQRHGTSKSGHTLDDLFELSLERASFHGMPVIDRIERRLNPAA
jgi:hypothetical protein